MSRLFKISTAISLTSVGTVGALMLAESAGLRLNFTESAPIGVWTSEPIARVERGSLVFCILDGRRLLKPVSAVEGDTVQIRTGYPAKINGKELPNTAAASHKDSWPDGIYTVKPGEVWVFSSYTDRSYDSRYFGPIGVSTIQGEAIPLLVVGNAAEATGTPL